VDSKSLDSFAKTKKDLYKILAIEGKLLSSVISLYHRIDPLAIILVMLSSLSEADHVREQEVLLQSLGEDCECT
jgi:hypothetical protein